MPRGYPHLVGTSHLGQQVRHDLALPRSTSTTLYQAVALPSFPLVKCTSTARSIACTAHSTAIRIPGPDHPRYFQHSCPSPCLDFGKAGTLPASQITGASTLAGLCNSLRVRGQISIQGPVHICFRPFTIPALHTSKPGSHLLQEAQSPHCSSLLSACLASTTPERVRIDQIREPGVPTDPQYPTTDQHPRRSSHDRISLDATSFHLADCS